MNAAVDVVARVDQQLVEENYERMRYARCIKASKRVRWDIEADVFRGRTFDFNRKFLPDGLTKIHDLAFLGAIEKKLMSHVQGRTYAYIFGLVERYIGAKVLELANDHRLGDQVVLEGLVRFSDEELKHQELFRRIEMAIATKMPGGYVQVADSTEVARGVLTKSSWAVLALTCHIELFTQVHYRESIERDEELSDLYRDVFRYHWLEECQHAVMDEIEWCREDRRLNDEQRDKGVTDFIDLIKSLDRLLQAQASADAGYFMRLCERAFDESQQRAIREGVLRAYRWQYIVSGLQHPHFEKLLNGMLSESQIRRIQTTLSPLMTK
ncbi:MAG TPA: hypothetical protein VNA21_13725 [Steroidobacteraceae bacterium]|nr:hypothetical protein [Steroidobacteraceae bacterium]